MELDSLSLSQFILSVEHVFLNLFIFIHLMVLVILCYEVVVVMLFAIL